MLSVLGVIPARYGSTRLPGKPLAKIQGKPMVEWVYRAARSALPRVVVATDDRRVLEAVRAFGGEAMMTPVSCKSGTDRMAFVARRIRARYYANIQGDEPLMHPDTIKTSVRLALKTRAVATPATDLKLRDYENPNVVKVVLGENQRALYFSRSLIPFPRDGKMGYKGLKHLGLYVYPKDFLFKFVKMRSTFLENIEKLEQLRALYYGMPIYVAYTRHDSVGVDTPRDLKTVARQMSRMGKRGVR